MRYELSPKIKCDLEEIADAIARTNPDRAVKVIRTLRTQLSVIAESPRLYQLRPDIGATARLAVAGKYIVLFHINQDHVRFERIVYGGRDLPALYEQRSRL